MEFMRLDLSAEETAVLIRELSDIIERDRYPLSPRIRLTKIMQPAAEAGVWLLVGGLRT
jgi:hypothetical protein